MDLNSITHAFWYKIYINVYNRYLQISSTKGWHGHWALPTCAHRQLFVAVPPSHCSAFGWALGQWASVPGAMLRYEFRSSARNSITWPIRWWEMGDDGHGIFGICIATSWGTVWCLGTKRPMQKVNWSQRTKHMELVTRMAWRHGSLWTSCWERWGHIDCMPMISMKPEQPLFSLTSSNEISDSLALALRERDCWEDSTNSGWQLWGTSVACLIWGHLETERCNNWKL